MFSKTFFAVVAVFAAQASAIALDAYDACNCPRNCDYQLNSGCKFYSQPSDTSDIIDGRCVYPAGSDYLVCVEQ